MSHARPRIGITSGERSLEDPVRMRRVRHLVLPMAYVRAVGRAGGLPVVLPTMAEGAVPDALLGLDGIVVSGGDFDVPPAYYGQRARAGLGPVDERRSAFERAVIEWCLREDISLLGICGGMQLLNVVRGGTLHQDLVERPGTAQHVQPTSPASSHHEVALTEGSLLRRICGRPRIQVNSTHHQVLSDLGEGLRAVGHAPDGVIEAIELEGSTFALGVQWHPEVLDDESQRRIYEVFVRTAAGLTFPP